MINIWPHAIGSRLIVVHFYYLATDGKRLVNGRGDTDRTPLQAEDECTSYLSQLSVPSDLKQLM
jgi:hypothetical protein